MLIPSQAEMLNHDKVFHETRVEFKFYEMQYFKTKDK